MIPNWSNIAISVKSIQPILRPTVLLQDHTTDLQISRATAGMRKNSDQANFAGRLGIWNLLATSISRKKAVGLSNADNQTTTLNQTGRLRRDCGIEAFICLTMLIWFLHKTYGPRNCDITPRRPNRRNSLHCTRLGRLQRLLRDDIWFLYKTPTVLLYKSSTRLLTPLPPGSTHACRSSWF